MVFRLESSGVRISAGIFWLACCSRLFFLSPLSVWPDNSTQCLKLHWSQSLSFVKAVQAKNCSFPSSSSPSIVTWPSGAVRTAGCLHSGLTAWRTTDHQKAGFARTGGQSVNLSLLSLFKRSFGDNSPGFVLSYSLETSFLASVIGCTVASVRSGDAANAATRRAPEIHVL